MNNPFGFRSLFGPDIDQYVRIRFNQHPFSPTLWRETFVETASRHKRYNGNNFDQPGFGVLLPGRYPRHKQDHQLSEKTPTPNLNATFSPTR